MKSFLKYTLATIVGIMIVHVILFFIFIGFIGAIASFSEKTVTVKNNSILTIKLEGEILDRTSDNPLDNIDFLSFTPKKNLGLNKILASIQKAAKDSRIQGIYLDLTEIQGPLLRKSGTLYKNSRKAESLFTVIRIWDIPKKVIIWLPLPTKSL